MVRKQKIAIGADHGGFILKQKLMPYLCKKGYVIIDFGTNSGQSCDYPAIGYNVAKYVADKKADFGIAICKTGFGMAIVANKIKGIRSAVCDSAKEAESARQHNDCNVLSLAAKRVNFETAKKIVDIFLKTKLEGSRHRRRVRQIEVLEIRGMKDDGRRTRR
jgi:ribose 5-phosphate isomerase B